MFNLLRLQNGGPFTLGYASAEHWNIGDAIKVQIFGMD